MSESATKGAISQLQEYVQEGKTFPMPPNCPVLHWDYDTRMAGTSLEFRATVAFLLDGVPHHSAGIWKPSKKQAQRDAAERALSLYHNWNNLTALVEQESGAVASKEPEESPRQADHAGLLRDFCARLALHHPTPPPEFSHKWDGDGRCQSFVRLRLLGVLHTFCGQLCDCREAAEGDVARRVLWYLQLPGTQDAFELDSDFVKSAAQTIPEPTTTWPKDSDMGEEAEKELVERKTTLMRVQNRLQQAFARQLEAGTSVWNWTYERDLNEAEAWPPLFRATVQVPLAGRTFVGEWQRGQREAQIDACAHIVRFLDAEFPRELRGR
jgi:hypothetical protein